MWSMIHRDHLERAEEDGFEERPVADDPFPDGGQDVFELFHESPNPPRSWPATYMAVAMSAMTAMAGRQRDDSGYAGDSVVVAGLVAAVAH